MTPLRRKPHPSIAVVLFSVLVGIVILVRYELPDRPWRSLLNAGIGFIGGVIFALEFICARHDRRCR
jgi:drug/metabolite transporter (DMT)-like permease